MESPAPEQQRDAAAVRIPPPLVFVGAMIAGVLLHRFVLPLPLPLPDWVRIGLGIALLALGAVLIGLAMGLFSRTGQDPKPWKPTPEIVTTGIFARTRNPMYIGMTAIQAAAGVALANAWVLALIPVALVAVYDTAIRHEEAYLEKKFGQAYTDYKRRVRRWL